MSEKGSLRVYWLRGEKITLARTCDISPPFLSELLSGRRSATRERAEQIEKAAADMGLFLTSKDLMFPLASDNPLMISTQRRNRR